jgi:hypothetical protein
LARKQALFLSQHGISHIVRNSVNQQRLTPQAVQVQLDPQEQVEDPEHPQPESGIFTVVAN